MMMTTPICDFINEYAGSTPARFHMPGHKGTPLIGPEPLDITEIGGADVLSHARGIILESEENAARIYGSARTLFSAGGSSLSIRAMLWLIKKRAALRKRKPLIAAARNVHSSYVSAAALLGIETQWIWPSEENSYDSYMSFLLSPDEIAAVTKETRPDAVYITSPDYLGRMQDIAGISEVCRSRSIPLLVDNAHGAYLKFFDSLHPLDLGADIVCDSAHKTLPVLTGGAYLHISKNAPAFFLDNAEEAMFLSSSTSPSYLVLESLDLANRLIAEGLDADYREFAGHISDMKKELSKQGYLITGDEPMKLALTPTALGYTGHELSTLLEKQGIFPEYSDLDHIVFMFTPLQKETDLSRLTEALIHMEQRAPLPAGAPQVLPHPLTKAMEPMEALLSESETVLSPDAVGRICAAIDLPCPPSVPIAVPGEIIDLAAASCLSCFGMNTVRVVAGTRSPS